jgi:capsule biosynthesis phosphatase
MKFILLCGGIGKRCNNYSLPKPLNYVGGKHMIEYIIESIPADEIYIIYNIFLEQYNFEEIVINLFKKKQFFFSKLDYLTRGAVETAYIGLQIFNLNNCDDTIVFLDNDNLHSFPNLRDITQNFIGYGKNYEKTNYSFVTIMNEKITNIEEKIKISDNYCCGIYGFSSAETFNKYAKKLIYSNFKTKNEFYFSQIYKLLIQSEELIVPVFIKETKHIGSYEEITDNIANYCEKKLRVCFDLDNTLVTFPAVIDDYSSVKPIQKNIELLKNLKKKGHEIIIYTARRMKTHNNNVGKVIKDIALTTINTLEKFDIQYDELIFGKPLADIYIDDKALNPYVNDESLFGLFYDNSEFIHNKISNNKYNSIKKSRNIIIKNGPYKLMKGELHFYQNIPCEIKDLFPSLKNFNKEGDCLNLSIDYIDGIPLFYLYKNKLLTSQIIDNLFEILNKIHSINCEITIQNENIDNNYFKKLKDRFNKNDYYFEDSQFVYENIIKELQENYSPQIVGVIHGDFWFSNIIQEYNDNYKLIDMKGQVDGINTLNGDLYYDYGKFYQSILGYDLVLNNCKLDFDYISSMEKYFLEKCKEKMLNINYLKSVTKSLIFGTLHSIEKCETKASIWNFLKSL